MKEFDLESKIKSLRAPKREDEYWEAFPDRVLAELRARPAQTAEGRGWMTGFFWFGRLTLACFALGFCLWQSQVPKAFSQALRKDEKELRQSFTRIENNLDRLMQDEHGLHRLVEEQS